MSAKVKIEKERVGARHNNASEERTRSMRRVSPHHYRGRREAEERYSQRKAESRLVRVAEVDVAELDTTRLNIGNAEREVCLYMH